MPELALYTYFRSSCAYRVRIALALKALPFDDHYVHLLRDGGENWRPEYRQLQPQGLVPALVDGQRVFTQSLAILEYLDEQYPEPPLLPPDARDRAYVRALAQLIASDIQPLNNLRVLDYLKNELAIGDEACNAWYRHWLQDGLEAFETLLSTHEQAGSCCFADTPTMADICLVPQVYNALRYDFDLSAMPNIDRIYTHCIELPAFQAAAPENQGDAA